MGVIIPQIILAGLDKSHPQQSSLVQKVIRLVEERFLEMEIKILVPHENFSLEELQAWLKEVSNPSDFFLNIQKKDRLLLQFSHQSEEKIASHLSYSLATRLGFTPDPTFLSIFSSENEESVFLQNLPVHVWNISFPELVTEKQLMLNVMACVTDMYTIHHELLLEEFVWPFRDVPSSHFAFEAIKKAKMKKIITGYKGDIFYPNGGITRGEVLYMFDKLGLL